MTFTPASFASLFAFGVILIFVISSLVGGAYYATRDQRLAAKLSFGTLLWLVLLSSMVLSGVLETTPMPGLPLFFAGSNLMALWAGLSPIGRLLAAGIPIPALVAFQGFRLPLELVLHSWSTQGTIPSTMTWSGSNFDIVSGILALALAPLSKKFPAAAWVVNGVGFILLLNVMRVAILSSPLPFSWQVHPPLLLALHLPYAWIVPICVGGALLGHIVLTRALLLRPRST